MENRIPLIGEEFPQITVKTTHGVKNYPDDLKGKWFVFFSHPADFTPVCTTEFVAFARRADEFRKLGAELVGLSIDQVFSHIKWVEWIKENLETTISFPVVADDTGEVAKKLGLIHPGQGTNTVRAVFIVDPEGTIRAIFTTTRTGRNMGEILRMVKGCRLPPPIMWHCLPIGG